MNTKSARTTNGSKLPQDHADPAPQPVSAEGVHGANDPIDAGVPSV
jgi:hypothetical protein